MKDIDLEDLKTKAQDVDKWYFLPDPRLAREKTAKAVAEFTEAANPGAVLELIERLQTAEAQLDAAQKQSPTAVYMGEHYIIGGAKYYRLILDRKLKDAAKFELYVRPIPA